MISQLYRKYDPNSCHCQQQGFKLKVIANLWQSDVEVAIILLAFY